MHKYTSTHHHTLCGIVTFNGATSSSSTATGGMVVVIQLCGKIVVCVCVCAAGGFLYTYSSFVVFYVHSMTVSISAILLYTSEEVRYWFYVRYSNEQIINWRTMDNNNNNCFVCQLLNINFLFSFIRYHETILQLYFETTCVCMWWCGKFLGKFLIKVKSFLAHYVSCRKFFFFL